jgi:hypothetical protein
MTPETADLSEFVLDGASFDDLTGFFAAITRTLGVSGWGRNLDAFNDILRGGFGTPDGGFILRWASSGLSAERLGWPETIRFIEKKLTTCHPANITAVQADLAAAHREEGQTLFEIILSIIRAHGPGGAESDDNVHLILALPVFARICARDSCERAGRHEMK